MNHSKEKTLPGISIFGDHVYVYLSSAEKERILNGEAVTIDLINHPWFNKIELLQDASISNGRWIAEHSLETRTIKISIGDSLLSTEINIEIGWHRNYIIRLEWWENECSDWEFAVDRARERLNKVLIKSHT